MLIIAERINASRKSIAQAISAADRPFIQAEAKSQTEAGAHYIDVNAGTFVGEEADKPAKPDVEIKRAAYLEKKENDEDGSGKVKKKLLIKSGFRRFFALGQSLANVPVGDVIFDIVAG